MIMSENSLSASETSNSQYLDDLANQNLNISQYLEGPTNPDLDIRQHLNDPTILSGCMVPVTIQSFTTDPDNITPTTITARLCGFGWGAVQFIAFYDSQVQIFLEKSRESSVLEGEGNLAHLAVVAFLVLAVQHYCVVVWRRLSDGARLDGV